MPTFARPLSSLTTKRPVVRPFSSTSITTSIAIVSLSCLGIILFARPNSAENLPFGAAMRKVKPLKAAQTSGTQKIAKTVRTTPESTSENRHSVDFYTSSIRGGMFSAPQPPAPKPKPVVIVKAPPKIPVPQVVPPMPINPFADWSYTGTVHIGDVVMALLENTRTKEGQYMKPGESFMGAQVQSIDDHMVTLSSGGKPFMLSKADTIIITPLNQNAQMPGLPGQPQLGQPQPGQPQVQQQTGITIPDANQQSITLPNGRVLTGDRAARYKQRLDSNFSGGGGRGGGRGNSGGSNGPNGQ